jgi:hypothetical protein
LVLECPAATVPELVAWTLAEAKLGAGRLHRSGKDSDPLIVVTTAAAARLGLPEHLEDRRSMRLPEDHKVVRQTRRRSDRGSNYRVPAHWQGVCILPGVCRCRACA